MIDEFDVAVVGAGVVGLAIARALSSAGQTVLLLERHSTFGTETSSRHSEVIHAGIYYPTATLKAALCLRGRELLYEYCERHGIPHARTGKVIAAVSEEEVPQLRDLAALAEANGVSDLRWLDAGELRRMEPELHAVKVCHPTISRPFTWRKAATSH
jgi:L-2-hydroxyglutarate oxidase LhgO